MFLENKFTYTDFLKVFWLICLTLMLASCGNDQCYISGDDDDSNVTVDVQDTSKDSNFTIDAGKSVKITVSGSVHMCNNNQGQSNIDYATTCKNGIKTICQNTCSGADCAGCTGKTISNPASCSDTNQATCLCTSAEDSICVNGVKWIYIQGKYQETEFKCREVISCSSSGTKQYKYGNQLVDVGTCTPPAQIQSLDSLSQYSIGIGSQTNQWTAVAGDVYAGDEFTFSIDKPTVGTPNALSKNENFPYQNSNNAALNRYASDKNKYYTNYKNCTGTNCKQNCPDSLEFDKSSTDYPNCGAIQQMFSGISSQSADNSQEGLWSTFGKNLVLQGVASGDCPTDAGCSGTFFNSSNTDINSNFGALSKITNSSGEYDRFLRAFVPTEGFSKICAKICDTDYTNNIGGYTLLVTRKSCVAVTGNPSPCCEDGRGALEYRLGEDGSWQSVSSTAVMSGGLKEENFTISNNTTGSQKIYFRIKASSEVRAESLGEYSISIPKSGDSSVINTPVSNVIEWIKTKIRDFILGDPDDANSNGLIQTYFENLSGNTIQASSFRTYIRLLLILYVILYGLTFLTGYTKISQSDLIVRALKIGVVLMLISDQSYSFFHDYFFQLFIEGSDTLICKANLVAPCSENTNTFAFIDDTLGLLFFNSKTWLKILSLLVSSPIGIVLFILFIVALVYFLIGVFSAVLIYLMCILGIATLILLAPIFIPFILFDTTRFLFDKWIKLLVRYALEPVLLIVGLQVLVAIFYAAFIKTIDFTVCWKCMIPINLGAVSAFDNILSAIHTTTEVFCLSFLGPFGVYSSGGVLFSGLGVTLANLILLVIIAALIRNYDIFVSSMLSSIVGGRPGLPFEPKSGSLGGAIRKKLKIDKLEALPGAASRKLIKATTGLDIKTKAERQRAQLKKDEALKRKSLRSVGIDKDKQKFNDIVDNLSTEKLKDALGNIDHSKMDAKKAQELGGGMLAKLSGDENAYEGFVSGLANIRNMEQKEAKQKGLEDLHRVLNTPAVGGSFADLLSENKLAKMNAMNRIGKQMFMDKAVSDALLNKASRANLSTKIFQAGRASRSGV